MGRAGTDDAHIRQDRSHEVAGPADPAADLSIGVTHAPYRRVLDPMVADGFPLVLAGHTHGGQIVLPGGGARGAGGARARGVGCLPTCRAHSGVSGDCPPEAWAGLFRPRGADSGP